MSVHFATPNPKTNQLVNGTSSSSATEQDNVAVVSTDTLFDNSSGIFPKGCCLSTSEGRFCVCVGVEWADFREEELLNVPHLQATQPLVCSRGSGTDQTCRPDAV